MNSDSPKTPREEMEAWLTALLLGELSEGEAAAVRALMAHDPELAKLHDRLKETISLVRETVPQMEAPSAAAEPLKLSEERRKQLLASFLIPPLKIEARKPRRKFQFRLIEVLVVLAALAVLAAMLLPALSKSKSRGQHYALTSTLGTPSETTEGVTAPRATAPTADSAVAESTRRSVADFGNYLEQAQRKPGENKSAGDASILGNRVQISGQLATATPAPRPTVQIVLPSLADSEAARPAKGENAGVAWTDFNGDGSLDLFTKSDSRKAVIAGHSISPTTGVPADSFSPDGAAGKLTVAAPEQTAFMRRYGLPAGKSTGGGTGGGGGGIGGGGVAVGGTVTAPQPTPSQTVPGNIVAGYAPAAPLLGDLPSAGKLFRSEFSTPETAGRGFSLLGPKPQLNQATKPVADESDSARTFSFALKEKASDKPTAGGATALGVDTFAGETVVAAGSLALGQPPADGKKTLADDAYLGVKLVPAGERVAPESKVLNFDVADLVKVPATPRPAAVAVEEGVRQQPPSIVLPSVRQETAGVPIVEGEKVEVLARNGTAPARFLRASESQAAGKPTGTPASTHEELLALNVTDEDRAKRRGRTPSDSGVEQLAADKKERADVMAEVTEGRVLLEAGKLDDAEVKLTDAIKSDPENRAATYYLALAKEQRAATAERGLERDSKKGTTEVAQALATPGLEGIVARGDQTTSQDQTVVEQQKKVERLRKELNISDLDAIGNSPSPMIDADVVRRLQGELISAQTILAREESQLNQLAMLSPERRRVAIQTSAGQDAKLSDDRLDSVMIGLSNRVGALKATTEKLKAELDSAKKTDIKNAERGRPYYEAKQRLGELVRRQREAEIEHADVAPIRKPSTNAPIPQPEIQTSENNFSTFSLNVSDVSFKLAAASLEKGQMPDAASVRSEEFINAFDYRDPEPAAGAPIAFAWERARYPFAHNRDLLRFSLKTAAAGRQAGRPLNIVLLLDNSGSMERADRVRIIREALRVLASQLQPQDKLSVITFARTPRLVADGISGDKAGEVAEAVSGLTPQGGTNLENAMDLAYQTAAKHYVANGINRVVMLTDGAVNLGNLEPDSLKQQVEAQRKQGIALDCFGIGWEGFNDDLLEVLSRNGDGRYGFLNSPEEAATDFVGQLAGALKVAASDVKVQVEFNPRRVTTYRQIGYAKHQLTKEQFRDNTVDAAEIAAQEAGNALYTVEVNPAGEGPLCTVRVRYKVPGTSDYREQAWDVPYTGNALSLEQSSPAMRLAASASAFSEWLVASPFAAEVTPDRVLGFLGGVPEIYGADARPKKLEWMIRQAKSLQGK